jgi:hypothetical protein
MKVGIMARVALPLFLSCLIPSAVAAQEAIPETPPELRDFRLDPERAQPTPQPEVQPPPPAPAVEPETQPTQPRAERPAQPTTRQSLRPAVTAPVGNQTAAPPEAVIEQPAEATSPSPEVAAPPAQTLATPTSSSAPAYWEIAAAVALAMLALLGGWLFLRKRGNDVADDLEQPNIPKFESEPAPKLAPTAPVATITKRPRISLEFVPEKATLGFSALTLKGQLRLVNEGDAPAIDMQLRATMISANQRQKETIAAFHGGAIPITPNPLGEAKAGERLALDIEMSVQVNELDSYTIGERKIFVPVMLANLSYEWEGGSDNVTMAWMVGRETEPAQPKMGPLRLDLGPRSFAPLGQRPIYA